MGSKLQETKATILVVDDNERNRMVVEQQLEAAGYQVITADCGERALELFAAEPASLVLLDILMPGIDGFETCRHLRALPRGDHTPIIFFTALDQGDIQEAAQAAGADDILAKPIHSLELMLRVRSLLRIRYLHDEIEQKNQALRRAAEARADRSEQRYRTLFDANSDAIIIHSLLGRMLEVNHRATECLGYSNTELRAMNVADLFPPAALDEEHQYLATVRDEGAAALEVKFARKDGTVFPAEVYATLFELDGEPTVQGLIRDITERKQAEQHLEQTRAKEREAKAQLRQAQKLEALGALAGGIAHDFNNLLTVILAFSRFARDDLPAGYPGRHDLDEVLRAADSATQLTGQLLSFARRRPVEPRVVDVREAVGNAQKMLRRTMGETIQLVVLLSEGEFPVLVDPGALDQIIFNLCVNARDAMPNGGTLTISVEARRAPSFGGLLPGGYVAITVADTGTGIAGDIADHIFEPFFSTKGEKGTGLGLATCYGIAKQADGEIIIDTEVGQGTSFTVLLPRAEGEPGTNSKNDALKSIAHIDGIALVVEDQPSILRVMCRAFKAVGFQVLEARTAEEGLAAFQGAGTEEIDLLVSDIVLPGQSGVWLMERIRESSPCLPVLLTSGYMGEDGPAPHSDEATSFLPKPFSAEQLVAKAACLLGVEVVTSS